MILMIIGIILLIAGVGAVLLDYNKLYSIISIGSSCISLILEGLKSLSESGKIEESIRERINSNNTLRICIVVFLLISFTILVFMFYDAHKNPKEQVDQTSQAHAIVVPESSIRSDENEIKATPRVKEIKIYNSRDVDLSEFTIHIGWPATILHAVAYSDAPLEDAVFEWSCVGENEYISIEISDDTKSCVCSIIKASENPIELVVTSGEIQRSIKVFLLD